MNNEAYLRPRKSYLLLLGLTVAFTLYQELYLRRWLFRHYGSHSVIAGSLPNLTAALLFAFAYAVIKMPTTTRDALRPPALATLGLVFYEIAQIWMPNRTFDWHDIWATLLGGLISFVALLAAQAISRRSLSVQDASRADILH